MIRLYFLVTSRLALLFGQRLYANDGVRSVTAQLLRGALWMFGICLIAIVFWDAMPVIAIGFICWHVYTFKRQERW